MLPDFSGENLRGRSFKGQNLAGANFSYADIRGADFTDAILEGANFSHAKAGLQDHWTIFLYLVSLVLALISGVAARFAAGLAILAYRKVPDGIPHEIAPVIVLALLAVLFIFIARRGITADLVAFIGGITGALIVVGAVFSPLYLVGVPAGRLGLDLLKAVAWGLAGTLPWAVASALAVAWAAILSSLLARTPTRVLAIASALAGIWILSGTTVAVFFKPMFFVSKEASEAWELISAVAVAVGLFGSYLGWRVLAEDKKFRLIRGVAVAIAATGGTSFRVADLTNADFTQAMLTSTDLRAKKLTRTNFYNAKKLDRARVGGTILSAPEIRDLVVTKRGANQSFVARNLKGANLASANLNDADLTEADVSEATFEGAWLERVNLTKAQAINTNFRQARLTGACLESWNIDSSTQLEGVICKFVYLLNNQQERRPSSGKFATGEFSKLFQVALNTVDLIFRKGLNLKALSAALAKVKVKHEGTELSLQSIENKGDGVVVARVSVSPQVDKAKLHADLTQTYKLALNALKERYRAEVKGKDEQIAIYRQHEADLKELIKLIASRPINIPANGTAVEEKSLEGKLVTLKLGKGDFRTGFPVTLQIGAERTLPSVEFAGKLPSALEILNCYSQWQLAYRSSLRASLRIKVPTTQITNVSRSEFFEECHKAAESLRKNLNLWLNSEAFRPLRERLLEKLDASESIRIILQTENSQLRRLPWHLWDFFERYPKAEIALSTPIYERIEKSLSPKTKVRILAILGDSTGIDIQKDREMLEQLPDAEVTFLVEPQRRELNEQLWARSQDILFFAGHSSNHPNGEIGQIYINQTDSLTIPEFRNALRKAIEQGLKLAIFNSCDGLGLAVNLADLHLPQMIVMREAVPDKVAQEFLKNFLTAFSSGKSLYCSVREAREKLQGLEDEFPCATWLPVICQNPAEVPGTWQQFRR